MLSLLRFQDDFIRRTLELCVQFKHAIPSVLQPLIELLEIRSKFSSVFLGNFASMSIDSLSTPMCSRPLKNVFPELVKFVRIAMTIAVNTAHCERSFSELRLTFDQQCGNSDRLIWLFYRKRNFRDTHLMKQLTGLQEWIRIEECYYNIFCCTFCLQDNYFVIMC